MIHQWYEISYLFIQIFENSNLLSVATPTLGKLGQMLSMGISPSKFNLLVAPTHHIQPRKLVNPFTKSRMPFYCQFEIVYQCVPQSLLKPIPILLISPSSIPLSMPLQPVEPVKNILAKNSNSPSSFALLSSPQHNWSSYSGKCHAFLLLFNLFALLSSPQHNWSSYSGKCHAFLLIFNLFAILSSPQHNWSSYSGKCHAFLLLFNLFALLSSPQHNWSSYSGKCHTFLLLFNLFALLSSPQHNWSSYSGKFHAFLLLFNSFALLSSPQHNWSSYSGKCHTLILLFNFSCYY